jgi:hypothetical protein
MGNDPGNEVDPTGGFVGIPPAFFEAIQKMGGTLDNVTVIGKVKTVTTISSSGALIDATKRIIEGGRIINSAFQKPSLFQRIGQFFLSAGPVIARGASVIGGVLIPIRTGEGASLNKEQQEALRKQFFELHTNDPSEASDQYLSEVEERLNSGKATSNDWRFKDEINRRKTARGNGDNSSDEKEVNESRAVDKFLNENELAKRLETTVKDYHDNIKPLMKKDFSEEMKKIGSKNPDFSPDDAGNIMLKNPQTGKTISTNVPLNLYKN